jgi:hypothetical protein
VFYDPSDFTQGIDNINWLCCVKPETSSDQQWLKEAKSSLSKILLEMNKEKDNVYFIALFSDRNLEKIGKLIQDVYCNENGVHKFVCICSDREIYKKFLKVKEIDDLSNDASWSTCVVFLHNWSEMNTFVDEICTSFAVEGTTVPLTDGLSFAIKPQIIEAFAHCGIEVVGINQCENLKSENAEEALTTYLGGNATWPDWSAFYFSDWNNNPNPNRLKSVIVRRRERVERLISDLEAIACLPNMNVVLKKLIHQPGAGASTVAMNAVWDLRKKYKCVRINAELFIKDSTGKNDQMKNFAEKILLLRSLGESEATEKGFRPSKAKPILILLDNSNEDTAKALRQSLQERVKKKEIKYCSTVFIILYLVQAVEFNRNFKADITDPIGPIIMKQELTENERKLFSEKLSGFKKIKSFQPAKMLEFMIMAHDFKDNDYVKSVVSDTLSNTAKNHSLQATLLLYLSMLKCYVQLSLPAAVCHSLMDNQTKFDYISQTIPPPNVLSKMCQEAQMFISEKDRKFTCRTGLRTKMKFKVLEVTHEPVARQILIYLSSTLAKEKVSKVLLDFLCEPAIMSGDRSFEEMLHCDVRKLLGE